MAREIATFIWCDPCNENEERTQGTEHVITYGGWKPRRIALCERHEKELLTPMLDFLKDAEVDPGGQVGRPRAAEKTVNSVECRICGSMYKNRSSLGSHLRATHNMGLSQYNGQYPDSVSDGDDQLPLDQNQGEELVTKACDVCHEEFTGKPSRINQMVGIHKRKKHDIKGTAK